MRRSISEMSPLPSSSSRPTATPVAVSSSSSQPPAPCTSASSNRITLDQIIKQYLRDQHRRCIEPVAVLPTISLFQPHRCPTVKDVSRPPVNVSARLRRRELSTARRTTAMRCDRDLTLSRYRVGNYIRLNSNDLMPSSPMSACYRRDSSRQVVIGYGDGLVAEWRRTPFSNDASTSGQWKVEYGDSSSDGQPIDHTWESGTGPVGNIVMSHNGRLMALSNHFGSSVVYTMDGDMPISGGGWMPSKAHALFGSSLVFSHSDEFAVVSTRQMSNDGENRYFHAQIALVSMETGDTSEIIASRVILHLSQRSLTFQITVWKPSHPAMGRTTVKASQIAGSASLRCV